LTGGMALELPGAVLFACNHNRVRSPMAEGLMKLLYGTRIYVQSAGVKGEEEPEIDPFAAAVMDELGVDLSHHHPKTFQMLDDDNFDVVISLTPEAQHRSIELARGRAVELEYWPTFDPTLTLGTRDTVLEAYRGVRDALEARIRERFGSPSAFGG
jgi:protein-tyrosine-phosphatase